MNDTGKYGNTEDGFNEKYFPVKSAGMGEDQPAEHDEDQQPFSSSELGRAGVLPHKLIEYVLGRKDRLMRNVVEQKHLGLLVPILFFAGIVFALPYGAVPPIQGFWKIAVLYSGSLMICFPSLFVFSHYIGFKLTLAQNLIVSLIISCVAAIFSLGFAPIIWFIDFTMDPTPDAVITSQGLSSVLLTTSLLLGIFHMARCLSAARRMVGTASHCILISCWVFLLAFITYRMASLLEIVSW